MLVNVTEDIANNPEAMILNRGYYGMNLRKEVSYHLSMYIKSKNYTALLQVMLGTVGTAPMHIVQKI